MDADNVANTIHLEAFWASEHSLFYFAKQHVFQQAYHEPS